MSDGASYILLVDDDPSNLFLLEALLRSHGYSTQSAKSGLEALAIARTEQPSMILLDVMMPGMDGFEVCRELRADTQLQATPVIFLTALADEQSHLMGLQVMGDDYFTKPVDQRLLLTKVASTLQLQQFRDAQGQANLAKPVSAQPTENGQVPKELEHQDETVEQVSEALLDKLRLFVPDQLLSRIAPAGLDSIQVGNATEAEVTILFSDIREFTAIAESQPASETFDWLNAFFKRMDEAIKTHHGFIDKYLGDAIMAVFDRPHQHAQDALTAAIAMQQTLSEFNRGRTRFNLEDPIRIGIGIHTGLAIIGTLGSEQRMDSTVIGDVVNTAARLEELTKFYGCSVLLSESVIDQLQQPELFNFKWLDCVAPRGKQQQSNLYQLLGMQMPACPGTHCEVVS
ncbi:response regulator [Leptolyngbya sp. FACHB-671]|uniref:adenylate/guanylate cyclase domain-containing protein n=1 Tax=unclassified Leptolyngbya TaxID=2650499 RepID=UPI0016876E19|nr:MULTISPECIES: adenylate/guanylate cyclase domain-containing protein [unclassified Leptolyngbya]MBD1996116.1 response regulator [Leptolyngbya sp. FACHB-541]MBD2068768.1 response regulator [Leptolyngbya sp. FACHB-671]